MAQLIQNVYLTPSKIYHISAEITLNGDFSTTITYPRTNDDDSSINYTEFTTKRDLDVFSDTFIASDFGQVILGDEHCDATFTNVVIYDVSARDSIEEYVNGDTTSIVSRDGLNDYSLPSMGFTGNLIGEGNLFSDRNWNEETQFVTGELTRYGFSYILDGVELYDVGYYKAISESLGELPVLANTSIVNSDYWKKFVSFSPEFHTTYSDGDMGEWLSSSTYSVGDKVIAYLGTELYYFISRIDDNVISPVDNSDADAPVINTDSWDQVLHYQPTSISDGSSNRLSGDDYVFTGDEYTSVEGHRQRNYSDQQVVDFINNKLASSTNFGTSDGAFFDWLDANGANDSVDLTSESRSAIRVSTFGSVNGAPAHSRFGPQDGLMTHLELNRQKMYTRWGIGTNASSDLQETENADRSAFVKNYPTEYNSSRPGGGHFPKFFGGDNDSRNIYFNVSINSSLVNENSLPVFDNTYVMNYKNGYHNNITLDMDYSKYDFDVVGSNKIRISGDVRSSFFKGREIDLTINSGKSFEHLEITDAYIDDNDDTVIGVDKILVSSITEEPPIDQFEADENVSIADNTITMSGDHQIANGIGVIFTGRGVYNIDNIDNNTIYYVIESSGTPSAFKLALAADGDAIELEENSSGLSGGIELHKIEPGSGSIVTGMTGRHHIAINHDMTSHEMTDYVQLENSFDTLVDVGLMRSEIVGKSINYYIKPLSSESIVAVETDDGVDYTYSNGVNEYVYSFIHFDATGDAVKELIDGESQVMPVPISDSDESTDLLLLYTASMKVTFPIIASVESINLGTNLIDIGITPPGDGTAIIFSKVNGFEIDSTAVDSTDIYYMCHVSGTSFGVSSSMWGFPANITSVGDGDIDINARSDVQFLNDGSDNLLTQSKKTFIHLPVDNIKDGQELELTVSLPSENPDDDKWTADMGGAISYKKFISQPRAYVFSGNATDNSIEEDNAYMYSLSPESEFASSSSVFNQSIMGVDDIVSDDKRVLLATVYPTALSTFGLQMRENQSARLLYWNILGLTAFTGSAPHQAYETLRAAAIAGEKDQNFPVNYMGIDEFPITLANHAYPGEGTFENGVWQGTSFIYGPFESVRPLLPSNLKPTALDIASDPYFDASNDAISSYVSQATKSHVELLKFFMKGSLVNTDVTDSSGNPVISTLSEYGIPENLPADFSADAENIKMAFLGDRYFTADDVSGDNGRNLRTWLRKPVYVPTDILLNDGVYQSGAILDDESVALHTHYNLYNTSLTDYYINLNNILGIDQTVDDVTNPDPFNIAEMGIFSKFEYINANNYKLISRMWNAAYTVNLMTEGYGETIGDSSSDYYNSLDYTLRAMTNMISMGGFVYPYLINSDDLPVSNANYDPIVDKAFAVSIGDVDSVYDGIYDTFMDSISIDPISKYFYDTGSAYLSIYTSAIDDSSTERYRSEFLKNYITPFNNKLPLRVYDSFRIIVNGNESSEAPEQSAHNLNYFLTGVRNSLDDSVDLSIDDYILADQFAIIDSELAVYDINDVNSSHIDFSTCKSNDPFNAISIALDISSPGRIVHPQFAKSKQGESYIRVDMKFIYSMDAGRWLTLNYKQSPTTYLTPGFGAKAIGNKEQSFKLPGTSGELSTDYIGRGISIDVVLESGSDIITSSTPDAFSDVVVGMCIAIPDDSNDGEITVIDVIDDNQIRSSQISTIDSTPTVTFVGVDYTWIPNGEYSENSITRSYAAKDEWKNVPYYAMSALELNKYCIPFMSNINYVGDSLIGDIHTSLTDTMISGTQEVFRVWKFSEPSSMSLGTPGDVSGSPLNNMSGNALPWKMFWNIRPCSSAQYGTDIPCNSGRDGGAISDPVMQNMFDFPDMSELEYRIPYHRSQSADWLFMNPYDDIALVMPDTSSFIMSGTTLASGTPQIILGYLEPQPGKRDFTIDWGDDTSSTYTTAVSDLSIVHVYPSNSTKYTITISNGTVMANSRDILFCDWSDSENQWITSIDTFGVDFFTYSMYKAFNYCTSLISIPDSWAGLENVTDINYCFYYCTSLISIPDSWAGLGSLTDISYCFYSCTSLTSIPCSWEGLESVTNLTNSFRDCRNLTTIPDSWAELESVTDMTFAFYRIGIASIPASWAGLENVTSLKYCFGSSPDITTLPDSWLDLESVTDISYCFSGTGITNIPGSWTGLGSVTDLNHCFSNCSSLTTLPDSWLDLESVTDISYCFYGSGITNIPDSWAGLGSVASMKGMFRKCTSLASLPDSWAGLGSVTSIEYAFNSCTSLTTLPESWAGLESVTDISYCFYDSGITSIGLISLASLANVTRCGSAFKNTSPIGLIYPIYEQLVQSAWLSKSECFASCTTAPDYWDLPSTWR